MVELIAVSGDEQSGTAGSRLTEPLVVEARGRTGQPIPDASISFSLKGNFGGGAVDPGTVATGPDGRAAAEVTLGQAAGIQAVEARTTPSPSRELVVRFLLTALLPQEEDDGDEAGGGGGGDEPRGDEDDDDGGGGGNRGRGGGGEEGDDDDGDKGNRGRGGGGGDDDGGHGGHGGGGGDDDDD